MLLDATLAERGDLRYTPAGVPALDCVLMHASVQAEAGGDRRVDCELAAVAFGEPATALAKVPTDLVSCYLMTLIYDSTAALATQRRKIGDFNAEQFRARFRDVLESLGCSQSAV